MKPSVASLRSDHSGSKATDNKQLLSADAFHIKLELLLYLLSK